MKYHNALNNFSFLPSTGNYLLLAQKDHVSRVKRIISISNPSLNFIKSIDKIDENTASKDTIIVSTEPIDLHLKNKNIFLIPLSQFYFTYWKHIDFLSTQKNSTTINEQDFLEYYREDSVLANIESPLTYPDYQRRQFFTENHIYFGGFHVAHQEIDYVRRYLSNNRSRDIYSKILCNNPILIVEDFFDNIYLSTKYMDYINLEEGSVILNVGVEKGTEIARFSAKTNGKLTIVNIDPFGNDHLSDYVKKYIKFYNADIREIRAALYNKDTTVGFNVVEYRPDWPHQAVGLTVKEIQPADKTTDYDLVCKAVTIDTIIKEEKLTKINLIKIDIEGGEEFITPHLESIINKHRPQLAISIYHTIEHMWKLPKQIIQQCKDYNFYCEHYSWLNTEVIFYAIPKEIDTNTTQHCFFSS